MDVNEVLAWLRSSSSGGERESLTRYGIPNDNALGVPMRELKKQAKMMGRSHDLALELWKTGVYEARTLAAFIDEADKVSAAQMDDWAHHFDSWAICDTVCFHLFDRTAFAWEKVSAWSNSEEEFVRRAAFALLWALALHDKGAPDERFTDALKIIENARPDDRPLVNKAVDMALRGIARRSEALRHATMDVAERMAHAPEHGRSWIGQHTLHELTRQPRTGSASS